MEGNTGMLFLFVISGAFVMAITHIMKKKSLDELKVNVDVVAVGTLMGIGLFALPAQIISEGTLEISAGFWRPFIITTSLNIVIMWGEVKSFALDDVSLMAAFQGVTPMFVVLTSWLVLGELPTAYGFLGILIIVIGVLILGIKKTKDEFSSQSRFNFSFSLGAKIALVTALFGAMGLPFEKLAVLNSSPMMLAGLKFPLVGVIIYVISKASGRWERADKKILLYMLGIGAILGLSEVLMSTGYLYGIVPYVGSLKRTSIIFVAILAIFFLKNNEKENFKTRIAGIAVIIVGIIFIPF